MATAAANLRQAIRLQEESIAKKRADLAEYEMLQQRGPKPKSPVLPCAPTDTEKSAEIRDEMAKDHALIRVVTLFDFFRAEGCTPEKAAYAAAQICVGASAAAHPKELLT